MIIFVCVAHCAFNVQHDMDATQTDNPFVSMLQEKEWCDFDEKANETVGIYNFEYKFELNKNK